MVGNFRYIVRGIIDLVQVAFPLPEARRHTTAKNILIFNWRDLRHVHAGGAEVYVHELAKRWVHQGHTVTLFCGNDGRAPRREERDGIRIVRRGGFYLVYLWAALYYLIRFRGRYDIIIDCHNGVPFFTPLYARVPVIGVVHHIHQQVFYKYLPRPMATLAAWLERELMPRVYRRCRFIAVSASTKHDMEALGITGASIEIVHNGVDLEHLYPAAKAPAPLVAYLGRLKAYKSVDVLLRAFHKVHARLPEARLIIAGSGEEEPRLKQLAAELGLGRAVQFQGHINETDKRHLLQRSWVLVNPSLMEGWGLTVLEANACGTPAVGANVAGLRDSIRTTHTGYLAPHGDTDAFAGHLHHLLTNHQLRTDMSRNAVQWAHEFEWGHSSRRALALIESEAR